MSERTHETLTKSGWAEKRSAPSAGLAKAMVVTRKMASSEQGNDLIKEPKA
jgi:hypothetical protein